MLERIWMIMRLISTCCSRDSNESEMPMVSDDHESMHSLWMYLWTNGESTVWVVKLAALRSWCVFVSGWTTRVGIPSLVARGREAC